MKPWWLVATRAITPSGESMARFVEFTEYRTGRPAYVDPFSVSAVVPQEDGFTALICNFDKVVLFIGVHGLSENVKAAIDAAMLKENDDEPATENSPTNPA